MANYSIRDLEKLSGIKAHTIRMWEKRYNLVKPMRTATNIRYYCDNDLKKLLNISILNRNGHKISILANLNPDDLKEKVEHLNSEQIAHHTQVEQLISSMIEMDEKLFEKILNANILKLGFENTVLNVIYPFLEKIGVLWQTGKINPAHEHFITNLLRQKIIVSIESSMPREIPNPKKFLLFLPEGELHELGLLFYSYIIKKNGHKTIYLGQTVPLNDLMEVNKLKQCDYILTAFITSFTNFNVFEYLKTLSSSFPDKTVFILGRFIKNTDLLPKNIVLINSPAEFLNKIA